MTDKIVIVTACETAEEADRIAQQLVEQQLAGCVNILGGARSVYRWKGAVEKASEILLLIKTSRRLLVEVEAVIATHHSYELPECIAIPIVDGSERYLAWLEQALRPSEEK